MKYFLLGILLSIFIQLIFFQVGDIVFWKTHIIHDLKNNQDIMLYGNGNSPYSICIKVKGNIFGKVKLLNDTIGPGKVDKVIYNGDFYGMSYKVPYVNIDVKNGYLNILYKFYY